jgi:hypothetical protein
MKQHKNTSQGKDIFAIEIDPDEIGETPSHGLKHI